MLYIDLPTRADLDTLLAHRRAPAVSIYVATTPRSQEAQADRIELKNLLKAAAQVGDAVTRRGPESAQAAAEPKRTRIIQSVLDTDPTAVGSIPARRAPAR